MSSDAIVEQFPVEPLLDISELAEVSDHRSEVPHLIPYLRDDEVVVKTFEVTKVIPDSPLSAINQMLRLTVGENGPLIASLSFPENAGEASLTKFESPFGRDSLIAARLLERKYPHLLPATLLHFARKQGVNYDAFSGEMPGGIVHDDHDPNDPIARKFAHYFGWKFPFYATVDAVPLFVDGIYRAQQRSEGEFLNEPYVCRDGGRLRMKDALVRAVDWIKLGMDTNPEGLLEYGRLKAKGIENQAWKDSYHAYVHKDGTPANHEDGIASVEVQGYAFDALMKAADMYEDDLHDLVKARQLRERAMSLRHVVADKFWVDNDLGGYMGLGTDRDEHGNLRLMDVRTSNMGHLLGSMILDGSDGWRMKMGITRNLFTPEMLAAGGFRTMASDEASFNPYSYHNGGAWPHDNAIIAEGLETMGLYGAAWEVYKRIGRVVHSSHCFPELVQGGTESEPVVSTRAAYVWDESRDMVYLLERPAQEIQAWAVAACLAGKIRNPIPGAHSGRYAMPKQAIDTAKRAFESELLASI